MEAELLTGTEVMGQGEAVPDALTSPQRCPRCSDVPPTSLWWPDARTSTLRCWLRRCATHSCAQAPTLCKPPLPATAQVGTQGPGPVLQPRCVPSFAPWRMLPWVAGPEHSAPASAQPSPHPLAARPLPNTDIQCCHDSLPRLPFPDACIFFVGTSALMSAVREVRQYGSLPVFSPVVEAEGWDRDSLGLPGKQLNLIQVCSEARCACSCF